MIITGAGGFAKEVLQTIYIESDFENIAFYDDINSNVPDFLFQKFRVLKDPESVQSFFKKNTASYTIGIGNPHLRQKMFEKFSILGGLLKTTISKEAYLGKYDVFIGEGCNILAFAKLSNSVSIGKCCIIYYDVTITHNCEIGDFVELSPGATLLGGCVIGSFSHLGANSTVLPNVHIGSNSIIGAGAVVTKNIPENSVAVGVPARIIRRMK